VFCDRGVAEPPTTLYDRCVAPLVDGLFRGYNATVFAYGQTGSGKTYTMGSAFTPGMGGAGALRGVIPQVMDAIFGRIAAAPRDIDFSVRVGFVEIHKEEIHDLLCTRGGPHPAVHIREAGGGVCLAGAMEREVKTRQEMVEVLEQGTLLRATAATGMNKQSSRSHAIFTITLEQRRLVGPRAGGSGRASATGSPGGDDSSGDEEEEGGAEEVDDSYLCAKMHLVDLAGSERAKRTKAVGQRLQEGININKGLLALGNVINALSEGKAHVPYRDSKLTRMLQDSLGGNSRTVMIACVSPADVNLEESLNTLRYANRARNIRNKPVINRDPVAAQIAHMRQQMAALRAENQSL
jgi:kinesin family protein 4/21/27